MNNEELYKAHKVGDIHPNGKWVWSEYKPGKFDWRGRKSGSKKTAEKVANDIYSGGHVLDANDVFLGQIKDWDVDNLKKIHLAAKSRIKDTYIALSATKQGSSKQKTLQKKYARLKDQFATIGRAIELKANGGEFKSWRDFMSYDERKKIPEDWKEKSTNDIRRMLQDTIKLRDSAMSSASTKLIARTKAWKLDRLLRAQEAANKANGYTADTANGGVGEKVTANGKVTEKSKPKVTALQKLQKTYLETLDDDFAELTRKPSSNAVGKLVGSTIKDAATAIVDTIRTIKDVTTVTELRKFDDRVAKARAKAITDLTKKSSVLQHNSTLARGRSVASYTQAISMVDVARVTIEQLIPNGNYRIKDEGKIEQQLIDENKW